MKKLLSAMIIGLSTLLASSAYANNPFLGRRGPTCIQPDFRRIAIVNEKGKQVVYDALLKHWTGKGGKKEERKGLGVFGILRGRHKHIDARDGENSGWSELFAGFGPRATYKDLHLLSYLGVKYPLDNGKAKIPLDTGSIDKKLGLLATQMIHDYEVDFLGEYAWTGDNAFGINPVNEFSFALVGGKGLAEKIRAVAGANGLVKGNGDYLVNGQFALRYTFLPAIHGELHVSEGITGSNIPRGLSLTAVVRYNAF